MLNVVLECLIKWYAPVLSFTTEEISELSQKDKKTSIHEENFPEIPNNWKNELLFKKWEKLISVRQQVNVAIEEKRSSKIIGSSLEADVDIVLPKQEYDFLEEIDTDLFFICVDNSFICILHGFPSYPVLAIPINGLLKSFLVKPIACNIAWAAG